jgi:hypothetical protein
MTELAQLSAKNTPENDFTTELDIITPEIMAAIVQNQLSKQEKILKNST